MEIASRYPVWLLNCSLCATLHIAPWCSILQLTWMITKAKVKHTGPGADYSVSLVSEAGFLPQVSGFNSGTWWNMFMLAHVMWNIVKRCEIPPHWYENGFNKVVCNQCDWLLMTPVEKRVLLCWCLRLSTRGLLVFAVLSRPLLPEASDITRTSDVPNPSYRDIPTDTKKCRKVIVFSQRLVTAWRKLVFRHGQNV